MGKIKEYLMNISRQIVEDEWLDPEDLININTEEELNELIDNAINNFIREEILPNDEEEAYFLDNEKGSILIEIKDLLEYKNNMNGFRGYKNNLEESFINDNDYLITELNESVKRWSFRKFEDEILKPLADEMGVDLRLGRIEKNDRMGKKSVSKFYGLGNISIMARDEKVVGMGVDDIEVWVLDNNDKSKGIRFRAGWGEYKDFKEHIRSEINVNNKVETSVEPYNAIKLNKLIKDLKVPENKNMSDAELYDIVEGVFLEEEGLEEFIRKHINVEDPLGWFVDQIS